MRHALAVIVPLAILAGCSHPGTSLGSTRVGPPPIEATTQLLGPNGELRGTATLSQRPEGTLVRARIEGMIAGTYAIHLHSVGKCEGPKFTSAGGHFNPTMKMHGKDNPMGPHLGDLPNVVVGPGGTGTVDFTVPGLMLVGGTAPLLDADGAAVVLHASPDDYKTDPSGASGDRIACGVLAAR
ncbi:superoxide dismutase family protein [Glacieibacterium megasporae]|uniref:superoxide dismutase family protein n=1 Tax=Glacieibacterium megasporae TaxID=2835787 RepID=UPI001C1DE0C9|nr:superoxide dismutase family protein [Polymorphobacter megasporae]UAJ10285.1 superoxide dismutase family protein [Polymorphobacter megasporae]